MSTAISVENLSKSYRLGQFGTGSFAHDLNVWWARARGKPNPQLRIGETDHANGDNKELLWALRDVSFKVKQGEVLGIIGRNGAGKSTLLKILSRVTAPTSGKVKIKGRIASLLEVGTGFHPELTGRENIYLNGAILGMKRAEIDRKLDEIVDFSGVEQFIDTPVKRYSSGMYVRLAFAVAAHLEPEILVVDEVLAVGDAEFQKKCLGKMGDVAKEGRTVLFVSHNMGAIRALCERGILISQGQKVIDSSTDKVITSYLEASRKQISSTGEIAWGSDLAPGGDDVQLRRIEMCSSDSSKIQAIFAPDESIDVRMHYQLKHAVKDMRVVLQILTSTGEIAFTATDHSVRGANFQSPGRYISKCRIPGNLLNTGIYVLKIWSGIPGVRYLVNPAEYLEFTIEGIGNHGSIFQDHQNWPGVVSPKLDWEIVEKQGENL